MRFLTLIFFSLFTLSCAADPVNPHAGLTPEMLHQQREAFHRDIGYPMVFRVPGPGEMYNFPIKEYRLLIVAPDNDEFLDKLDQLVNACFDYGMFGAFVFQDKKISTPIDTILNRIEAGVNVERSEKVVRMRVARDIYRSNFNRKESARHAYKECMTDLGRLRYEGPTTDDDFLGFTE